MSPIQIHLQDISSSEYIIKKRCHNLKIIYKSFHQIRTHIHEKINNSEQIHKKSYNKFGAHPKDINSLDVSKKRLKISK